MKKIQYICLSLLTNMSLAATYIPAKKTGFHISESIASLTAIIQNVCMMYGISMVLLGLYKIKAHRDNPVLYPIGKVLSLVVLGLALVGVSFLQVTLVKPF